MNMWYNVGVGLLLYIALFIYTLSKFYLIFFTVVLEHKITVLLSVC